MKRNNVFTGVWLVWLLLIVITAGAQTPNAGRQRVITGPDGAVILFGGLEQAGNRFPARGETIEVYRGAGSGQTFRRLASTGFPASARELQQRLGAEAMAALQQQLKASSAEAAYATLLRSSPDTLGFLAFSLPVLEALGLAYTDKSWKPGEAVVYRLGRTVNGATRDDVYTEAVSGRPVAYNSTYKLHRFATSDSSVSGIWSASREGLPLFARVYERRGNAAFIPQENTHVVYGDQTTGYIQFNQAVQPGTLTAYYIRPLDWAGNLGPASDTLYTAAINVNNIASVTGLRVTDTLEGLLLQWEALPRQAIYSGIQIMKSRRTGSDYVVLDTIAATENRYLDRQLLPHVNYYYKVQPLLYSLPGREQLPAAEAMGARTSRNDLAPPAAPLGVQASVASPGIRISWDPVPGTDIFAYYVLRGTSLRTLEVISAPVRDTVYIDSLFAANDAGQLVYAVQAMALDQAMSDTSEAASIAVRQPVVLPAPGGLQARRGSDGNYLQWDPSPASAEGVEGYMVYRRKAGDKNFMLLTRERVTVPFYTDSLSQATIAYEYGVTSIDVWGNQSILSPTAIVATDVAALLNPPAQLQLRNLTAGIEVSWPLSYEGGDVQFVIYRKRVDEASFRRVSAVKGVASYTDKQVQKGVLYVYAVALTVQGAEGIRTNPFSIRR